MIVIHNYSNPKKVATPYASTIVSAGGKDTDKYNAYSVKSTVTWPDPSAYNETETDDVNNLSDARMDVVNHAKIMDVAIGCPSDKLLQYINKSGETNLLITSPFGNWRDYSTNGFCDISHRVLLNVENKVLKNGVEYTIEQAKTLLNSPAMSMVKGAITAMNTMAEGASMLTGQDYGQEKGEYVSRLQNVPVCKPGDTKTTGIDSLKFKFRFGQAQIFSAEEEVVKPILALANIFMPKTDGSNNRIITPIMSSARAKTRMFAAMLKTVGKGLKDALSNIVDSAGTGESVVNNGITSSGISGVLTTGNKIVDKIFGALDDAALSAISETTTIIVNIGGAVSGPYVPSSINWDFDFNDVDEFGYPCSGEINFTGLQPVILNCSGDVIRQWGYETEAKSISSSGLSSNSPTANSVSKGLSGSTIVMGKASSEDTTSIS